MSLVISGVFRKYVIKINIRFNFLMDFIIVYNGYSLGNRWKSINFFIFDKKIEEERVKGKEEMEGEGKGERRMRRRGSRR